MSDQANVLRGLMEQRRTLSPSSSTIDDDAEAIGHSFAHTIAVTSGKGGVGKSNIALNLAIGLSNLHSSVCLIDASGGLGNIDLLCGLNGYWNLSHVITGARKLSEVVLDGPSGISVIPGASGLIDAADCPPEARFDVLNQLEEIERQHDHIIIDTGTGSHRSIRNFVTHADISLVVTTPETTSIANAYATIKELSAGNMRHLEIVVNQAESAKQAYAITERVQQTAQTFLHADIGSATYVPLDRNVQRAVSRRQPFLEEIPHCPASKAVQQLARRLKYQTDARMSLGSFFPRVWEDFLIPLAS